MQIETIRRIKRRRKVVVHIICRGYVLCVFREENVFRRLSGRRRSRENRKKKSLERVQKVPKYAMLDWARVALEVGDS